MLMARRAPSPGCSRRQAMKLIAKDFETTPDIESLITALNKLVDVARENSGTIHLLNLDILIEIEIPRINVIKRGSTFEEASKRAKEVHLSPED
jgi:hypothetical protein